VIARYGAQGQDEIVVFEKEFLPRVGMAAGDCLFIEVESVYRKLLEICFPEAFSYGDHDVLRLDAAGYHFGEHGCEHEIVVLVDERYLDVVSFLEMFFKMLGRFEAAEAAAQDEYALFRGLRHGIILLEVLSMQGEGRSTTFELFSFSHEKKTGVNKAPINNTPIPEEDVRFRNKRADESAPFLKRSSLGASLRLFVAHPDGRVDRIAAPLH
jgi:hypothetical protein